MVSYFIALFTAMLYRKTDRYWGWTRNWNETPVWTTTIS